MRRIRPYGHIMSNIVVFADLWGGSGCCRNIPYIYIYIYIYIPIYYPIFFSIFLRPALRKAARTQQQKRARPALHRPESGKHKENMHKSWCKAGRTQGLPPRKDSATRFAGAGK